MAEYFIKNKSKFRQKTLTQACDFFSRKASFDIIAYSTLSANLKILNEKTPLFDAFSGPRLREILKMLKQKMTNSAFFEKKSHV